MNSICNRFTAAVALICLLAIVHTAASRRDEWTAAEFAELSAMSIATLGPLDPDPTNRVADDPRATALGHRLFFDTRFSSNRQVSCATCHHPDRGFQDGKPLASGVGTTGRRAMPITATARSPFLFWDGRKDSQWAQALGPLESAVEHGGTRVQYARVVAQEYRTEYESIFGPLPDLSQAPHVGGPNGDPVARASWLAMPETERDAVTRIFTNVGKAIAAYERRIGYAPSRVDRYIDALRATGRAPDRMLTADEIAGLKLFAGKANCTRCHNGPLLTNNEFHNTGVPARAGLRADRGRLAGSADVLRDEFNCRSQWSDATTKRCAELDFLVTGSPALERAFKVPSLRNVAERAPYMHAGQMTTLAEVLDHYNRAPAAPTGHTELEPLHLKPQELGQLEALLRALSGGIDAPAELLRSPDTSARGSR